MFKVEPSKLAGCYKFSPKIIDDVRGRFVKIFHEPSYAALGLETNFAEEYYSISHNNVIRGLHFQVPPMDHVKIVYCLEGHALDVVLDLRVESPTFGQFDIFELDSSNPSSIYIPKGMAHGFCALGDNTIMVYKVSTIYSSTHDGGILWNSVGIQWPTTDAVISARDQGFPTLAQFRSPFRDE
jgi:dTDP-4-dehydrorhamnose 3,5-epimerase